MVHKLLEFSLIRIKLELSFIVSWSNFKIGPARLGSTRALAIKGFSSSSSLGRLDIHALHNTHTHKYADTHTHYAFHWNIIIVMFKNIRLVPSLGTVQPTESTRNLNNHRWIIGLEGLPMTYLPMCKKREPPGQGRYCS